MSDIPIATAATSLLNRQQVSIASLKQALQAEAQITQMVSELTQNTLALNSSGRGQVINTFV